VDEQQEKELRRELKWLCESQEKLTQRENAHPLRMVPPYLNHYHQERIESVVAFVRKLVGDG